MNPEKVLPPGVNGKISGHLTVQVDEVFWTKHSPGEVFVELLWWGEKESSIFRPEDISFKQDIKRRSSLITYTIRTSPGLFESYIRNCGKLTFTIIRGQNKNVVIGSCVVKDLEQIISEKNYHSYFPIFSPKGIRLGDLHICFELTFKPKQCHFTVNCNKELEIVQQNHVKKQFSSKSSTATSQDQLLSDTLQKGQELRKAMVMSVLADCPIDKIDSVVNSNAGSSSVMGINKRPETKLVDFLLGKDMSPDEEARALEMLRCISPDENLLNIAENCSEPKVTKTTCCLHGKKCKTKKIKKTKSNSADVCDLPSTQPSSSSSDVQVDQVAVHGEKKEEPKEVQKSFNCYELIIKTLNLTSEGARKIYYAPSSKDSERPKFNQNPPGTTFILEIILPSKGPWSKTLKFTTKSYKDKCVEIFQGTTHKLCGTASWERVKTLLLGAMFTIYWRHLNQRVPCPLGSARLDTLNPSSGSDFLTLSLPVYSNTKLLTGHLNICVKLCISSRSGGESLFKLKGNEDITSTETPYVSSKSQDTDDLHSDKSNKVDNAVSSEPSIIPLSSASSDDSIEAEPGPSSLDDELVKTINLLNSKTDNPPVYNSAQVMKEKNPVDNMVEACVQTTLPLETPKCLKCSCSIKNDKPFQREVLFLDDHFTKDGTDYKRKTPTASVTNHVPSRDNATVPDLFCNTNLKKTPFEHVTIPETVYPEFNDTEKIHEYTVKIEKVFGVPLFTGDNDLDCYINYTFPKVDSNGRVIFDSDQVRTEVKIALREIEFVHMSRHRLRLGCKLTRALLSLPTNEITFYLWGRFYSPTLQDYRLGKATLSLAILSGLELKYEQRKERQPITEKFILPISVLETSLTSGYQGPFGEIHISITYSNASSLSYREWRCNYKNDHYWCRSQLLWNNDRNCPNYGCNKAQSNFYGAPSDCDRITSKNKNQFNLNTNLSSSHNFETFKTSSNKTDFNAEPCTSQRPANYYFTHSVPAHSTNCTSDLYNSKFHSKTETNIHGNSDLISSRKKPIPSTISFENNPGEKIIQTNLKETIVEDGFITERSRVTENSDMPSSRKPAGVDSHVLLDMNKRMQPIGASDKCIDYSSSTKNYNNPKHFGNFDYSNQIDSGKRENIVAKVLRDIKQRKELETQLDLNNDPPIHEKIDGSKDAFDSFQMRTDLPTLEDTSDFEVNSQYSFLKTPPPVDSIFPNDNCSDFDSGSSLSAKQRVQLEQVVNPFTSQSHLSLSLNSDTSMFKNSPEKAIKTKTLELSTKMNEPDKDLMPEKDTDSTKSSSKPKKTIKKSLDCSKKEEKYSTVCEPKNDDSSDETLKSVESIKSYKEYPLQRQSRDVAVGTDFDIVNKDTQTSLKEKNYFKARVEISEALDLPSLEVKQHSGKIELVKPTSHAYFTGIVDGKEVILKTPTVEKKSNPVWDSSWEVYLPSDLLKKCDRELEIFVELNADCNEAPIRASDGSMNCPIVLRTGVDLTCMTAGLDHTSGWFSLSDRALLSCAQIMVVVTPLEDISCFKDDWLRGYTKSKNKKNNLRIPERSLSITTSLQEKLSELEKLTERMKCKIANRSRWDVSPPLSLLAEVHKKSINVSLENIINQGNSRSDNIKNTTETATSPIALPGEAKNISVIDVSDEDEGGDKGSCAAVETYTICETSSDGNEEVESNHHDSLETPSETIDRILNRKRKSR